MVRMVKENGVGYFQLEISRGAKISMTCGHSTYLILFFLPGFSSYLYAQPIPGPIFTNTCQVIKNLVMPMQVRTKKIFSLRGVGFSVEGYETQQFSQHLVEVQQMRYHTSYHKIKDEEDIFLRQR